MSEEVSPPDHRFTLANERTCLAWIRTALGLIAGGVALTQWLPSGATESLRRLLGVALILVGGVLAGAAVHRWTRVQQAMERGRDLPPNRLPLLVGATLITAAVALAALSVMSAS